MPEEEVEPDGIPGESAAAEQKGQSAFAAWQKEVEAAQDVQVRNLTFVDVLPCRAVHHILPALARIYARLRSLGLPRYRLHCDRARELISAPVRRWTLDRGIITTLTSGDSYKSNGRVEGELGVVKKHVRTIIAASDLGLESWPLAAIHIGERRLRGQLRSCGIPVGPLSEWSSDSWTIETPSNSSSEAGEHTRFCGGGFDRRRGCGGGAKQLGRWLKPSGLDKTACAWEDPFH